MTSRREYVADFDRVEMENARRRATPAMKRRLDAVLSVFKGQSVEAVADETGIDPRYVRSWIRAFNDDGITGLLSLKTGGTTPLRSDYDAEKLRAMAAEAVSPAARARLFAIASLYEGDAPANVATSFGVSVSTVERWRTEFNSRGPGVARPVQLNAKLSADIVVAAGPVVEELRGMVHGLAGEAAARAKAVLLSAGDMDVESISFEMGRSRAWTVTTLKSFKAVGMESVTGVPQAEYGSKVTARPGRSVLPDGYSATSLREAAKAETDPEARNALEVLAAVYLYGTRDEAARVTGTSSPRVASLVRKLESGGIAAVTEKPSWKTIDPSKVEAVAEGYQDNKAAARLFALARVIRGESFESVAADTGATSSVLRELMSRLDRFGTEGVPDMVARNSARAAANAIMPRSQPEKKTPVQKKATVEKKAPAEKKKVGRSYSTDTPKTETVATPIRKAASPVAARIVEAARPKPVVMVAQPVVEAANPGSVAPVAGKYPVVEAVRSGEPDRKSKAPFIFPKAKSILDMMAKDEGYPGRRMAAAVRDYCDHGDVDYSARAFRVNAGDIVRVFDNIGPTTTLYANTRAKRALDDAEVTIGKIRKLAANPPHGWMSKLRNIALIVEGRTLTEVSAASGLDPAKLVTWTEELATSWKDAKAKRAAEPVRKTAGFR